jgi:hypothetical protein
MTVVALRYMTQFISVDRYLLVFRVWGVLPSFLALKMEAAYYLSEQRNLQFIHLRLCLSPWQENNSRHILTLWL